MLVMEEDGDWKWKMLVMVEVLDGERSAGDSEGGGRC
jgi:hypothetical protein